MVATSTQNGTSERHATLTADVDVPPAGRKPVRKHLAAAAIAALCAAAAVWIGINQAQGPTVQVAVAATDLAHGTAIEPENLTWETIGAADTTTAGLIGPEQVEDITGWVVAADIDAGDLVPASAVTAPPDGDDVRAMSIPLPSSHAVAGELQPGDRSEIVAVIGNTAEFIATDVPVLAVGTDDSASVSGEWSVTVAVEDATVLRIAQALADGRIHLTQATGVTPAQAPAATGNSENPEPEREGNTAPEDADSDDIWDLDEPDTQEDTP